MHTHLMAMLVLAGSAHLTSANHVASPGPHTPAVATGSAPVVASRVTIIVMDDFSTPGIVALVRRVAGSAETLIAVKKTALTPPLIAAALRLVPKVRDASVDPRAGRVDILVRSKTELPPVSGRDKSRVAQIIAQLKSAPKMHIPNVGSHPAITMELP